MASSLKLDAQLRVKVAVDSAKHVPRPMRKNASVGDYLSVIIRQDLSRRSHKDHIHRICPACSIVARPSRIQQLAVSCQRPRSSFSSKYAKRKISPRRALNISNIVRECWTAGYTAILLLSLKRGEPSASFCPYAAIVENQDERLFQCQRDDCGKVSCRKCHEVSG